jgi:16S rRNA (cytosine967-C5)-methyltransferase
MTPARDAAARVLVRVEKERAFAAAALEAELARAVQLTSLDRALATELVYGTLRVTPWLEAKLASFAPRGTAKLDVHVRACLRLAAYQLFFTRVPAFAAVNEAVQAVRDLRGPRVAAFANAVLRKVATEASQVDDADKEKEEALVASTPPWLRDGLERSLGPSGARAFLRCSMDSPAVALRIEQADLSGAERDAWLAKLRAAAPDASFEAGRVSPLAILARGAGKPQRLPGWSEGSWSVQEEGSQLAAIAVGAQRGETVLDACAGRGNKTAILARAVGDDGAVDACDASPAKLERLGTELARVGLGVRATFAVDWSVGSGDVAGSYDRVLVDAPCSGVGTLRRRPEIALRRQTEDLEALARVQFAVAHRAAGHVRPGGSLVYVVCSVLREEGQAVVDALVEARPDFERAPFDASLLQEVRALEVQERAGASDDGSSILLLPHVHGTDGYYVARLVRRRLQSEPPTL